MAKVCHYCCSLSVSIEVIKLIHLFIPNLIVVFACKQYNRTIHLFWNAANFSSVVWCILIFDCLNWKHTEAHIETKWQKVRKKEKVQEECLKVWSRHQIFWSMKSLIRSLIWETQPAGVLADRDQRRFDFEPLFIYFRYKPIHIRLHTVKRAEDDFKAG